ncbi:glycoside hydrolase family 13 protein [Microbacterium oryzae]|uniref:glycoside hydrolase family 13 protein n=1 Tax=Microbacterium oryzae TaxID=743009 RepID=UPI0025B134D7|nr:glycoside hydrolase family 13 protein [Microbacterium oryzae]MDN3311404.1 glycoside hydrolase family 13 protein [Microbacterium oryzae]
MTTLTETTDPLLIPAADWWRQAAVYQIYPRSFADANGDGIGDLRGIMSRIPYLQTLGIDAVWLSPFYPSALADGGYDVDDYRDVDPRIGTLDEFDEMVAALHAAGIRLIVDLVPNHSSDRHEWFQEALASPAGSPARERYIFRDGRGENGELPPADWESIFGGPAWTRVADGQWYLHLFATEQPDLNWDNEEVRADFRTTLRFWADRGVDGFRVDVAHGLAKDLPEQLPSSAEMKAMTEPGQHPLWDRDEVHDIYADWRRVFDEYDPPKIAVAEAWVESTRRPRYASAEGLGQAFNFDLLEAEYDAAAFRTIIADNLAMSAESGSSTTWVFSNHDVVRHATRYGLPQPEHEVDATQIMAGASKEWLVRGAPEAELDRDLGLRRARAATLLELALPGSAYLYQGEELGLHEVGDIPAGARQDPSFFRSAGAEIGRDGCRVPLPWTSEGPSFGFGANGAHLPQPAWFADVSVEAQEEDPTSTLNLYREALRLRHELQTEETLAWDEELTHGDVLAFTRPGGWVCVMNFGDAAGPLPEGEVLLASGPLADGKLPGATTVWLRRG